MVTCLYMLLHERAQGVILRSLARSEQVGLVEAAFTAEEYNSEGMASK